MDVMMVIAILIRQGSGTVGGEKRLDEEARGRRLTRER